MLKFEELLRSIDVIGTDVTDSEQIKPAVINAKLESVGLPYNNLNVLIDYKFIEYSEIGEVKFSPIFSNIYNSKGQPFSERISLFRDNAIMKILFKISLNYFLNMKKSFL